MSRLRIHAGMIWATTVLGVASAFGVEPPAAGEAGIPHPFLFLKTGEKFATQEAAGPTVTRLTAWLGDRLEGNSNWFSPRVLNDPVKAAELCASVKPVAGIVTPGFYLTYGKTLGMEPLLETKREGVPAERYVLVARKSDPDDLKQWEGKSIATALAAEQRYVIATVLQGKCGPEVRLRPVPNVELAVFDLVENAKNAADAVLVDEPTWKLFESDGELGPKLKVIYRSDDLPRDLVVLFPNQAAGLDAAKLKDALRHLNESDAGRTILQSIRVESFDEIDRTRLENAQKRFYGP